MSYCRFSSDNWKSDVYVYESDNGFVIHVAGARYTTEIPNVPPMPSGGTYEEWKEWFNLHNKQMKAVSSAPTKTIGGDYDSQTFICETAEETLDKLKDIKEHGYNVPDFAFESLKEEISG